MRSGEQIRLVVDARMVANSGIGTYLRNVLQRLVDDPGLSITCLGDLDLLRKQSWISGVVPIPFAAKIYSPLEQLALASRIPVCDVFWTPHFNVPFLPIRAKRRMATIHDAFHLAHSDVYRGLKRVYAELLYRKAYRSDAVVTVSEFSRTELRRLLGKEIGRVSVIPNGVDPSLARGLEAASPSGDYLLFVGNLKPHKNLKNALMAFRKIHVDFPDLRFLVVGRKEGMHTMDREIVQSVADLPAGKVVFLGEVTAEELRRHYQNSRLFLFPSLYEGFGLPILEAMVFDLPILASDIATSREIGGDAIGYFDPNDVGDIAEKIRGALRDPIRKNHAAYRSRIAHFSWERSAEAHAAIIKSLAGRLPVPGSGSAKGIIRAGAGRGSPAGPDSLKGEA